jgi:hypothetical protein
MPGMDFMDRLFGPFDELVVSRLISNWRESVWKKASRMLDSGLEQRAHLVQEVERDALHLGKIINL